jgi:hypothetical protein
VIVWPSHAEALQGTIYRFINGKAPAERDFLSHYEREPLKAWGVDECKARGLSVLRTWSDCGLMRKAVPALRKKKVAVADVAPSIGLIATTPSRSCAGHCTWWFSATPDQIRALFSTCSEP